MLKMNTNGEEHELLNAVKVFIVSINIILMLLFVHSYHFRNANRGRRLQVILSLGHTPRSQWHRCPCRPHNRWVDQFLTDNNLPPADLWRHTVSCGHRGAMLRLLPAKWWQQQQEQEQLLVWCPCKACRDITLCWPAKETLSCWR